jgi:hypothetical protein
MTHPKEEDVELAGVSVSEFVDGYIKPMISGLEREIVRLRGELQLAEHQRDDLLTTQRVLRAKSITALRAKAKGGE